MSTEEEVPFLAVGADELETELKETVSCWICGETHPVEYGERVLEDGTKVPSKMLAFFRCGGECYLCGINGKELRPRTNPS